ncbi:hypothetical protein BDF20DRAFT_844746 [Mycotypha africana]|uniref:uncharacterized protein n=1 Tax=Mycotypha africana TaxID=64632 RepID=UPI0023009FEE|nr:uncharacterized protein BDF20DRAFT_844746 [Mycotypha africana]KAI8991455.1 hypothetical protein BDF20DRAFT_844746 [Mycotypha africana]
MHMLLIVILTFSYHICLLLASAITVLDKHALDEQLPSKFQSIVAFGDSMTDNGSFDDFYAKNTSKIDPESLHSYTSANLSRACDGPVWVEHLATSFGSPDLYNFARVAASINNSLVLEETPYDLNTQVTRYLTSEAATLTKNNTIFFIYIGGNEVFDMFKVFPNDSVERRKLIEQLMLSARFNLERLYAIGARYIMLLGQLPLEDLPMRRKSLSETRVKMGDLVREFNINLERLMEDFTIDHTELKAIYFDLYYSFKPLFVSDTGRTCISESSCEGYVFYDRGHPTSLYHAQIAQAIRDKLIELAWYEETEP